MYMCMYLYILRTGQALADFAEEPSSMPPNHRLSDRVRTIILLLLFIHSCIHTINYYS